MKLSGKELDVLRAIQQLEVPTRRALSRRCHMSTVLVSSILKHLEQQGFIEHQGKKRSTGGRPSIVFQLNPDLECYAGIEVKPDRIVSVLIDAAGETLYRNDTALDLTPSPDEHVSTILDLIATEYDRLREGCRTGAAPAAVGVSVPGMVDTKRGIWLHGLQVTGIERVHLRKLLRERIGAPCIVEDSSRNTALYEHRHGTARGLKNFVLIYLGVGVGSGIIINGRLYRGHDGLAGEVGHLVVEPDGNRCICGSVGCLETIASTRAIVRRLRDRLNEGVYSTLQQYSRDEYAALSIEAIREAAISSDRLTTTTLSEVGELLGDACVKIMKLFAPEKIVLSGPASLLGDFLEDSIHRVIDERVLPELVSDDPIVFASYTPDDEALGAAFLAMDYSWNNSAILSSRLEP